MQKGQEGEKGAREGARPYASIVMPTYMEEKYLGPTLESIFSQKVDFTFEVIVSDASSTDKTGEITRKYGARLVLGPKTNIADGRRIGAQASKGEILIFATGDNIYTPGWLANLVAPFKDAGVAAVVGKIMLQDSSAAEKAFANLVLWPGAKLFSKIGSYYAHGEALAIRRSVYDDVGGINIALVTSDDTELVMRASRKGRIFYADKSLVLTSRRRLDKWGRLYFLYFHVINYFQLNFLGRAFGEYEPIR
ncbi:MAG: glycosyltransferase [Candidatus Micrarchaeia archaeon]